MTFSRKDVIAGVVTNLGDPGNIDVIDMLQFVDEALVAYSKNRPLTKIVDFTADGSTFDFPVPSDYVGGISELISIEYPAGMQVPLLLENTEWGFYLSSAGVQIRFSITPTAGHVARVLYTAAQAIGIEDGTTTTVPDIDMHAIVYLATSKAATSLAAKAARISKGKFDDMPLPGVGPVVDYTNIAEKYLGMWNDHMEITLDGSKPAFSSQGNIAFVPSWNSGPLLRERRSPIPGF
jgi:hypothetical protein